MHALCLAIFRDIELLARLFGIAAHKDKSLTSKEKKEIYRRLNHSDVWKYCKMAINSKKDLLKYIIFRSRMDYYYFLTK